MTVEPLTLTGHSRPTMSLEIGSSLTAGQHAPLQERPFTPPIDSPTSASRRRDLEPLRFNTSRVRDSYEDEKTPNSPLSPLEPTTSFSAAQRPGGIDEAHSLKELASQEGDSVLDSRGKVMFPPETTETEGPGSMPRPNPFVSLTDETKSSSPLPWEVIDPPPENSQRDATGSQRYQTMRSTTSSRPLKPKSSYYFAPPPPGSAYGTPPCGHIGVHQPREILRVERDYTIGELIQFTPIYPLELEGRITPTQFLESINSMNEILISAHSSRHAFLENLLSTLTLQVSRLIIRTHYEREMNRLHALIDGLNAELYNPVGLNILWPKNTAFLFLEIEYY